ncbi:MAG: HAD family hydrolase [Phycisphaerales bacterium]
MLILFDIDATMISTSGAGMKAMLSTGQELFGESFSTEGIEFAGRLDPLIISDLFVKHGVTMTPQRAAEFRVVYREHLIRRLAHPETIARSLPGVLPLMDALARIEAVSMGVLTGNFQETGSLKLQRCGIDPARFHISVWGDESPSQPPTRVDLPGVAMKKYHTRYRSAIEGDRVVVIGDTPHDVRCAKAHGCRSLAVATGSFGIEQLTACEPTLALADLSDWREVCAWLMNGR